MTDQNKVTVQELAQAKKETAEAIVGMDITRNKLDAKVKLLPEQIAYDSARDIYTKASVKSAGLEAGYKIQLADKYAETGEKQHPGGSVAVGTKFIYDDSLIIPWLREHSHPELITEGIKKAGVKKLAQAVEVNGVTTEETITPKINTDLSEFLPQEASND